MQGVHARRACVKGVRACKACVRACKVRVQGVRACVLTVCVHARRACKVCEHTSTSLTDSQKNVLDLGRLVAQFMKYLGRLEAFRQKNQRISPHRAGNGWFYGFRRQGCGYPGILASFVTYVRLPHYDPREGGQIAKKWSENDPLVVGVGEEEWEAN